MKVEEESIVALADVLGRTKRLLLDWWTYNEQMGISKFILKRASTRTEFSLVFVEAAELVFNAQDMNLKHLLLVVVPAVYHVFSPTQTMMATNTRLATNTFYNMRNALIKVLEYVAVQAPSRCVTPCVSDLAHCSPFAKQLLADWNRVYRQRKYDDEGDDECLDLQIRCRFIEALGYAIKGDVVDVTIGITDKITNLMLQFLYDGTLDIWDQYRHVCDINRQRRELNHMFDYANRCFEILCEVKSWIKGHRLVEAFKDLCGANPRKSFRDLENVVSLLQDLDAFEIRDVAEQADGVLADTSRRLNCAEMDFSQSVKEYAAHVSLDDFVRNEAEYAKLYFRVVHDFYWRHKQKMANVNYTYCLDNLKVDGADDPYYPLQKPIEELVEVMKSLAARHVEYKRVYFSRNCPCKRHRPEQQDDEQDRCYLFDLNEYAECQETASVLELHSILGYCDSDDCRCKTDELLYSKHLLYKQKRCHFWFIELVLEFPVREHVLNLEYTRL